MFISAGEFLNRFRDAKDFIESLWSDDGFDEEPPVDGSFTIPLIF